MDLHSSTGVGQPHLNDRVTLTNLYAKLNASANVNIFRTRLVELLLYLELGFHVRK